MPTKIMRREGLKEKIMNIYIYVHMYDVCMCICVSIKAMKTEGTDSSGVKSLR